MNSDLWQFFSDQPGCQIKEGLVTLPGVMGENFETLYLKLRTKEGRLYSDEVVKLLPEVPSTHQLSKEWSIRSSSAQKLTNYIVKQDHKSPTILDIGCGNGWFANYLSQRIRVVYCGVDVNKTELEQAVRLFTRDRKVFFLHADISTAELPKRQIDFILLASSIQYFNSLNQLIARLLPTLTSKGEIHIVDSPLYKPSEVSSARARTRTYFQEQGFEAMSNWYHHHTWQDLASFNFEVLSKPSPRIIRIVSKSNSTPFPWIKITA